MGGRPALWPLSVVCAAPTALSHSRGTKPRGRPKRLHYCRFRGHSYTVSHRLSLGSREAWPVKGEESGRLAPPGTRAGCAGEQGPAERLDNVGGTDSWFPGWDLEHDGSWATPCIAF